MEPQWNFSSSNFLNSQCYLCFSSVAVASFVQEVVTVTEGPGVSVNVCVSVVGARERAVSVDLQTESGTALGMYIGYM